MALESEAPASQSGFRFLGFAIAVAALLLLAGGLNWLVDPLWYAGGNRLTKVNYIFNERIAKANLLRRTAASAHYDCLILGSSRVTALRPSDFAGLNCFNFALKGAEAPELMAYGRYALDQGVNPATVFVAVDDFNFLVKKETERRSVPHVEATPNAWHAFFSSDVLMFSLMTLARVSPDPDDYYDARFELQRFPAPVWQPRAYVPPEQAGCKMDRVATYRQIRALFPQAKVIAYTPPMSPWHQLSEVYLRGVLDCELDAFHAVAQDYDGFLDFGIPTPLTLDNAATQDGNHYSPDSQAQVVASLQGRRHDLALDVKSMSLAEYKATVRQRLKAFVDEQHLETFWRE